VLSESPVAYTPPSEPALLFTVIKKSHTAAWNKDHIQLTTLFVFYISSTSMVPSIVNNFNNYTGVTNNDLINPIEFVNRSTNPIVKFLGVLFYPTLNFKAHISSISSKISISLVVMRRAKNFLAPVALQSLYYSLVHSHLIYCMHIWSSASSSSINELLKKQKIAIRLINGASYNAHTEVLFKNSSILPLDSLIEYFKLKFVYLFIKNHLPISFANTWINNSADATIVMVLPSGMPWIY
jgi:hypothetical protein